MSWILSFLPVISYWTVCVGCYYGGLDSTENIINPKNTVTLPQTIKRVIYLHILQIVTLLPIEWGWIPGHIIYGWRWHYILLGFFLMDTVQYFSHRLNHAIPWLYAYSHKIHHEMKTTWSFGALYNSYSDALLVGSLLSISFFWIFHFTLEEFSYIVTISNIATIIDHVDYFDHKNWFGRKGYHRHHHETNVQSNFQQPFFTFWDKWLGSYEVPKIIQQNYAL